MDQLIAKLGIDWRLLIAQLVNFTILLFILYKFLYKPLLKLMDERTKKIEASLEDARKIGENLARSEKEREEMIIFAKDEALKIIEGARKEAEKEKHEIAERARLEAEKISRENKKQLAADKDELIADIKKEMGKLIILAASKILDKNIDEETNRKIIEKTLEEIK